jgi:putative peptidoglycan lipid II flippase
MNQTKKLFQSSVLVMILFGLGKVTGLVRSQLVAGAFGTDGAFDAFTAANQLPEVFVTLLAGGALAAAFIPVYSKYLTDKKQKEALQIANTTLTLVLILLTVVSAVGVVIAPWWARVVQVPNFSPEQQALTANIMRIILVQTTLFGVSGVLSSILNAHQHFALPAFAPVMLDVGYLVGIFLFVPTLGIYGLAWGTVVGGVLHILVQVPALIRYKYSYRPALKLRLPGVREILWLMIPRLVTLGSIQVADLFIVRYTSGLPAGSTSGYFYGYYLQQLPETLLGTAIAIVVFPTMVEQFNAGNIEAMKRTAISALRIIWVLTIPAAVGLLMLGQPIIALVFQRGAFDAASTALVYGIVVWFSLRVVSEATLEIVARLLYAQHDTFTPMFAYMGWLVVSIVLMQVFFPSMGVAGLALASTVAFTLLAIALFVINRIKLGYLYEGELLQTAIRAILAAGGMALVIWSVGLFLGGSLWYVVVGGIAGILTYFTLQFLLGGQEIPDLISLVRNR